MRRVVLLGVLALLLSSCGGDVAVTQTGNPSQVSLYTQVGSKNATPVVVSKSRSDDTIRSLTITSAHIVVEEVALLGDGEDELSFKGDRPYVINIALDSSRQLIDSIIDTAGSVFTKASLFLAPLEAEDVIAGEEALVEKSILISGYVDDDTTRRFTFTSDMETELLIPLPTALVVNGKGTSAFFLTLDVGSWFLDEDGEIIDPFDGDFIEDIEKAILEGIYGTEEDEDEWEDEEDEDDEEEDTSEEEDRIL